MWVGAGMAIAQSSDIEGRGPREHRQQVAVAAHAEEDEIERRPGVRHLGSDRSQFVLELGGAPRGVPATADDLAAAERMQVLGRDVDPVGLVEQDLVEGLHVRERVVARDEAVVAPPDVDRVPVDGVAAGPVPRMAW